MSSVSGSSTPNRTKRQHRQGFSVSSVLSFLSGSEVQSTPIRTINTGSPTSDASPTRVLLPHAKYPSPASFAFSNICNTIDHAPLDVAMATTVADVRQTFSEAISTLVADQQALVTQMNAADAQVKQVVQTTNTRIRKTEKEAELLAGSERLSVLAEKSYEEVERILKLFREIDDLLPAAARLRNYSAHYKRLSPAVNRTRDQDQTNPKLKSSPAPSRAVSSLLAVQESSPVTTSSRLSIKTSRSVSARTLTPNRMSGPEPGLGTAQPSPTPEQSLEAPNPPRLRLAPRKSRSNLRVPQIRTVPPLPSTHLSTALPNVERDNMSTMSSVASRRSVFSTFSRFLGGGQSSRRTMNESTFTPPLQGTAEERLRKISGSSPLIRGRNPGGT